jgi:virginiamycin A acetyltransferase
MRSVLKSIVNSLALLGALPLALCSGFGRINIMYAFFAQSVALIPGLPGDYLRTGYYVWTLQQCSMKSRVSFGSFFAQSSCRVGDGVYIGAYCILGSCSIGARTQIASHVQILSGRRQHGRNQQGQILGAHEGTFTTVTVGADCWLGAAAIIMEDVGEGSTVGAGAVVTRPIPPKVVAVGNPARVIRSVTV